MARIVRQGTAMLNHRYFDTGRTLSVIDQAHHAIGHADTKHVRGLMYSSPKPWILALTISITMWGVLAWIISGYL